MKNRQLRQRYKEQTEIIDFGTFFKDNYPKSFDYWKSQLKGGNITSGQTSEEETETKVK